MAKNRSEADATPQLDQILKRNNESESSKVVEEFYKSYDLMTGVRIAATLGGFFGIMVLLVVYKSKCKSRSMSEENLQGVTAGVNSNCPGRRNLSLAGNPCWVSFQPANRLTPIDTPSTPPAVQVIQATPEISPCVSKTSVYKGSRRKENLCVPNKSAPLASLSSFGIGSTERDDHSVGSDSVFLDEELIDTEDEVEGFSTDSDVEKIDFTSGSHVDSRESDTSSVGETRRGLRRYSSPNPYLREKEKNGEGNNSWKWRRFSGSWKRRQDRLPLPSTVSLNRETLF